VSNWRKILYPFSLIYGSVAALRNIAFDRNILFSKSYDVPVIAIGNLSTGGTGKTPMTEYLIELLQKEKLKVAVVSRGYGRKTKGLLEVKTTHASREVGDEPLQMALRYPDIKMVVAEKRQVGIDYLLEKYKDLDAILLDDAFQHRYVKAGLYIMLSSFQKPYYNDLVLPAGNLREFRFGKKRANLVVITKCPPELKIKQAETIKRKVKNTDTYFSSFKYSQPLSASETGRTIGNKIIVISGIAQPKPMLHHLKSIYQIEKHFKYSDHYNFTEKDLNEWKTCLNDKSEVDIVTTEKDWSRLKNILPDNLLQRTYLLPVKTHFLFEEQPKFNDAILSFVKKEDKL